MKKLSLLLLPVLFFACKEGPKGKDGTEFNTAVSYNDYIINRQSKIIKDVLAWADMADINLDSADAMLGKMVKDVSKSVEEIKEMPAFEGNTEFRDAAISSFEFYKKTFGDEYKQIISFRRKGDEITHSDRETVQGLIERITEEEAKYDRVFKTAQKSFAGKHKLGLIENELQKSVDSLN